jgi:hypothetical protein
MALMVVGSVAVWTVIPIAGLWLASRLTDSPGEIGVVPLLVAVIGIPAAMGLAGRLLAQIERLHMRITGAAPQRRGVPAVRRSLGEARSPGLSVLDRIMIASVFVAVIAMAVWFFAFAGSSVPS